MKYLALDYIKNCNTATYDRNINYFTEESVIRHVSDGRVFSCYEDYLEAYRSQLDGLEFNVIRCDDFDDIVIIWAEATKEPEIIYDYVGYFQIEDMKIRRIDELWCPRRKV